MSNETELQPTKLTDFIPDPRNANRHTERGGAMMGRSLEECGVGDSLTVTADNVIISGSQRTETMVEKGMVEPIIVESDGTRPIIHKRTDLMSNDPRARKLAVYLNRVAEVNLSWDPQVLAEVEAEGARMADLFTPKEMHCLFDQDTSFLNEFISDQANTNPPGPEHFLPPASPTAVQPAATGQTMESTPSGDSGASAPPAIVPANPGASNAALAESPSPGLVTMLFTVTAEERTEIMQVLNAFKDANSLPTAGSALYQLIVGKK